MRFLAETVAGESCGSGDLLRAGLWCSSRSYQFSHLSMLFGLACFGLLISGCGRQTDSTTPTTGPSSQSAPGGQAPLDRRIRILLLDGSQTAGVVLSEPFNVVDPDILQVLRTDEPPGQLSIIFARAGIEIPELQLQTERSVLDLVPLGEQPVQVRLAEEWKEFRGTLRFLKRPDGGAVIDLIDVEDYLVGVVSSELPAGFHREMFRAQAIAARTYAWYARQTTGLRRDWDVWASERSQVYGGLERERLVPQAADAVRETRGIVCTWSAPHGEKIFCTYFSSRCGGITAAARGPGDRPAIPPLAGGVECPFCRRPDSYRWRQEPRILKTEVSRRLAERYPRFADLGRLAAVEVVEAGPGGRVLRVAVRDVEGVRLELDGENFRLAMDPTGRVVESTCFEIVDELEAIVLTNGKGMGHGMGMCQYGANALAKAGWDAPAILRHYYPGSHLTRAY